MDRVYRNGYILKVKEQEYEVIKCAGSGSSATAYYTKRSDGTLCVIKEYDPKNLDLTKKDNGEFDLSRINEKDLDKYLKGLNSFIESAEKQKRIRNGYTELTNSTIPITDIVRLNDMAYVFMPKFYGKTYEEISTEDENLLDLLTRTKSIAKFIGYYHKAGLLHLDIKPSNVLIMEGINDLVLFFDFNSVFEKKKIWEDELELSYSVKWAAPEVRNYRYHSLISEKSDIYSIGEILFFRLFGQHSDSQDRFSFSKYDFSSVEKLENVDSKIKKILTKILRKTLCVDPENRYSDCSELVLDLEEALRYTSDIEPYLISSNIYTCRYFCGREQLISDIKNTLDESSIVVLSGMGGIGKTELALNFAKQYSESYDYIIHISNPDNWYDVVNNHIYHNIANIEKNDTYNNSQPSNQLYDKIIKLLNRITTTNTLFVLDNLKDSFFSQDQESANLRKSLFAIPANFLITTRMSSELYCNIEVKPPAISDLCKVFRYWSGYKKKYSESIKNIIAYVGNHTLIVELLAKQIKNEGIDPDEKYNQLHEKGLPQITGKVKSEKDRELRDKAIVAHLVDLFDIDSLDIEKREILLIGSLLPPEGIKRKAFNYLSNNSDGDLVDALMSGGWLSSRINKNSEMISVHPLIAQLILSQIFDGKLVDSLLNRISSFTESGKYKNVISKEDLRKTILSCFYTLKDMKYESDAFFNHVFVDYDEYELLSFQEQKDILVCGEEIYGNELNEESLLNLYYAIAKAYFRINDDNKAMEYCKKISDHNSSSEYAVVLRTYVKHILGEIYLKHHDYELAIESFQEVLEECIKLNEDKAIDSYELGRAYISLVDCCYKTRNYTMMRDYIALAKDNVLNRPDSGDLHMQIMFYEGMLLDSENKHADAEELFSTIIDSCNDLNSRLCANAKYALACVKIKEKKTDNVERLLKDCLTIRLNTYVEKHQEIAAVYLRMGEYYSLDGKTNKATEYFDKAYDIYKCVFGFDCSEIYDTLIEKTRMIYSEGDYVSIIKQLPPILEECVYINRSYSTYLYELYKLLVMSYRVLNDNENITKYYNLALQLCESEQMLDKAMELKEILSC